MQAYWLNSKNLSGSAYDILGVNPDATPEEIKSAYRREAMKWHPDRNQGNREESERRFKDIGRAYSVLQDPAKRTEYDQQILGTSSANDAKGDAFSQENAFATFLAAVLDRAFELALGGADQITIYRALTSEGCPETIAQTIAQHAYSMAHRTSKRGQANSSHKAPTDEMPHKKPDNATGHFTPSKILRSGQTSLMRRTFNIAIVLAAAIFTGSLMKAVVSDYWSKSPSKQPVPVAKASIDTRDPLFVEFQKQAQLASLHKPSVKDDLRLPGNDPNSAIAEMVVKIGHVAPLTGPIAHLGKDNENGARLAVDDANAKKIEIDGKIIRFELLGEDDQAHTFTHNSLSMFRRFRDCSGAMIAQAFSILRAAICAGCCMVCAL